MKKDKTNKIMAIFVILMFAGSGIVAGFLYIIPGGAEKDTQLYFDRPLENSEEAPYLLKNYVIIKLFLEEDDTETIELINDLFQDLNGKIIVEFIDVDYYSDYFETFETDAPFIYLKGKTIDKVYEIEYQDLRNRVCDLYFEPIEECE